MGQCSEARLFYGFELLGVDLAAFCSALRSCDKENLDRPATVEHLKSCDLALVDLRNEILEWLEAPGPISVDCNFDENASEDDDAVIALYYSGDGGIGSVEKWGYQACRSQQFVVLATILTNTSWQQMGCNK